MIEEKKRDRWQASQWDKNEKLIYETIEQCEESLLKDPSKSLGPIRISTIMKSLEAKAKGYNEQQGTHPLSSSCFCCGRPVDEIKAQIEKQAWRRGQRTWSGHRQDQNDQRKGIYAVRMSRQAACRHLEELVAEGKITRTGRGAYSSKTVSLLREIGKDLLGYSLGNSVYRWVGADAFSNVLREEEKSRPLTWKVKDFLQNTRAFFEGHAPKLTGEQAESKLRALAEAYFRLSIWKGALSVEIYSKNPLGEGMLEQWSKNQLRLLRKSTDGMITEHAYEIAKLVTHEKWCKFPQSWEDMKFKVIIDFAPKPVPTPEDIYKEMARTRVLPHSLQTVLNTLNRSKGGQERTNDFS